jgi:hypothetical protein
LRGLGYKILWFGNFEVDREFDGVLEAIRLALEEPTRPLRGHPPLKKGRDETEREARACLSLPGREGAAEGGGWGARRR